MGGWVGRGGRPPRLPGIFLKGVGVFSLDYFILLSVNYSDPEHKDRYKSQLIVHHTSSLKVLNSGLHLL